MKPSEIEELRARWVIDGILLGAVAGVFGITCAILLGAAAMLLRWLGG